LNRGRGIPDNPTGVYCLAHATGDRASTEYSPVTWPRRALVGLFVLAFVLTTVGLVARWDSLMLMLSRPPVSTPTAEAVR
jgi:hypothetical protein